MASPEACFPVTRGAFRLFCFVLFCFLHSSPFADVLLAHLLRLVPLVIQWFTEACNVIPALIQEGVGEKKRRISADKHSHWPAGLRASQQVATEAGRVYTILEPLSVVMIESSVLAIS